MRPIVLLAWLVHPEVVVALLTRADGGQGGDVARVEAAADRHDAEEIAA